MRSQGMLLLAIGLAVQSTLASAQQQYVPAQFADVPSVYQSNSYHQAPPVYQTQPQNSPEVFQASWNHGVNVDGSCGVCVAECCDKNDCCDDCGTCHGGWFFGAEAVFVQPHGADAFYTIVDPINAIELARNTIDYDMQVTPRAWFGYTGDGGTGFRVSWWEFDSSSEAGSLQSITDQGITNTLVSGLDFVAIDGEITQTIRGRRWDIMFGGGVRYAQTNLNISGLNTVGFVNHLSSVGLDGLGPTGSVEVRRRLGLISLYGSLRGSMVFGEMKSFRAFDLGGFGLAESYTQEDLVSIVDLKLGAEFSRDTAGGRFFVRGGVEAQLWENVGGFERSPFDGGLLGAFIGQHNLVAMPGGDVSFLGATAAAGVTR